MMGADATMWGGQWDYVWAAYALTFVLSALVLALSYGAMRRAEARAEQLKRGRN